MKKLIITLTIICFAIGVKAQTFEKMPDTKPALGGITLIDYNALDTLKCWFKESLVVVNNATYPRTWNGIQIASGDSSIIETWHRGYMIVTKYGWVSQSQGKLIHQYIVNYLYTDRKTIVKNKVLEHIEL